MKLVKLEGEDGSDVFVNPEHVAFVHLDIHTIHITLATGEFTKVSGRSLDEVVEALTEEDDTLEAVKCSNCQDDMIIKALIHHCVRCNCDVSQEVEVAD
jgi:hypothetical protein